MAAQSLFQRTHTDEFRFLVVAGYIEDFAVESLHNKRFLDRQPTDRNAWMVDRRRDELLTVFDRLAEGYGNAKGRPSNGYVRNLILAAAAEAELANGQGATAAYRAAARRLGEPMTKDKVQKAHAKFRANGVKLFLLYLVPHEAEHRRDCLVAFVRDELDRHERDLLAERERAEAERRTRRFAGKIGGCFGADDADRFSSRTRGAK